MLTFYYVIEGPPGSPYEGGHYLGALKFPPEYPLKCVDSTGPMCSAPLRLRQQFADWSKYYAASSTHCHRDLPLARTHRQATRGLHVHAERPLC